MGERVILYVDGFNLYYGIRKIPNARWLDLAALAHRLLPHDEIVHIKYFTARLRGTDRDPGTPLRQSLYLRAIRTLPNVSIHFGRWGGWRRSTRSFGAAPCLPASSHR